MTVRVIIADDQPALREEVTLVLGEDPDISVVGTAENGAEAVKLIEMLAPDIAILDVAMPTMTGIEATAQLTQRCTSTKVVALSMHSDASYVRGMMEAGARGYVLKDCASEELAAAVHSVLAGKVYLSPDIPEYIAKLWRG